MNGLGLDHELTMSTGSGALTSALGQKRTLTAERRLNLIVKAYYTLKFARLRWLTKEKVGIQFLSLRSMPKSEGVRQPTLECVVLRQRRLESSSTPSAADSVVRFIVADLECPLCASS